MSQIESVSLGKAVVVVVASEKDIEDVVLREYEKIVNKSVSFYIDFPDHGAGFMKIVGEIARTMKITAIKLVRQQFGCSLVEAKKFTEACIEYLPVITYN